jgi:hypothetical protein
MYHICGFFAYVPEKYPENGQNLWQNRRHVVESMSSETGTHPPK